MNKLNVPIYKHSINNEVIYNTGIYIFNNLSNNKIYVTKSCCRCINIKAFGIGFKLNKTKYYSV